ncbi:MAG TPA: non-homologous end-joining DNA ligase [Solirubrobacterales bacterium]
MARPEEPMKAKLHDGPFDDPGWVFERKLDGIRAIVRREGPRATLTSRTGKDLTSAYPELVEALEAEPMRRFLADGEIVAFEGNRTSFERLQGRMGIHDPRLARLTGIPVYLYLFDLLELDGHDTTGLPLRSRKDLLRRSLDFKGPIRFTPHRNEHGTRFFAEACAKGWEGLIAKRAESPYVHARSGDWLKLRCSFEQELVIGGFTPPQGARKHFGALLVGYHEDGELRYAGKVGTGFSERVLADLARRMEALKVPHSPFARDGLPRQARWVRPELVGQFAFSEWTRDGKLRHPRYLGLREDKPASEVVRELPGG